MFPGLGARGGAPAVRARPTGAVPAQPRAALSLPCPALPCPTLPCLALRCSAPPCVPCCGRDVPGDCGAGSPGLSDYVFSAVPFGSREKGWGKAGGAGRRPWGPSRTVVGAEPRWGRWVPVLAGSPAGTRGLKDRRKTCLGPVLYVCMC